jgi:hypothetical protein
LEGAAGHYGCLRVKYGGDHSLLEVAFASAQDVEFEDTEEDGTPASENCLREVAGYLPFDDEDEEEFVAWCLEAKVTEGLAGCMAAVLEE